MSEKKGTGDGINLAETFLPESPVLKILLFILIQRFEATENPVKRKMILLMIRVLLRTCAFFR